MLKKSYLLAATVAACCTQAFATTGNDLLRWAPEYEKELGTFNGGVLAGYVVGVNDALSNILFCPPAGVTNGQLGAIALKYIRDNPERWNESGAALMIDGFEKAFPCKK